MKRFQKYVKGRAGGIKKNEFFKNNKMTRNGDFMIEFKASKGSCKTSRSL